MEFPIIINGACQFPFVRNVGWYFPLSFKCSLKMRYALSDQGNVSKKDASLIWVKVAQLILICEKVIFLHISYNVIQLIEVSY